MTVGILTYPLGGLSELRPRSAHWAYRRALLNRTNPRSPEYMRELFAERYPGGTIETEPPAEADEVVLLYPDAVGLGFGSIERKLPRGASVRVLNGRRRDFPLDRRTKAELRLRRALHRTMAGEVAFVLTLAVAAPALLAADFVRGRR
jgi:hypothetical protein